MEMDNLLITSSLILASACARKESRGLHYNVDFPVQSDNERYPTILTSGNVQVDLLRLPILLRYICLFLVQMTISFYLRTSSLIVRDTSVLNKSQYSRPDNCSSR